MTLHATNEAIARSLTSSDQIYPTTPDFGESHHESGIDKSCHVRRKRTRAVTTKPLSLLQNIPDYRHAFSEWVDDQSHAEPVQTEMLSQVTTGSSTCLVHASGCRSTSRPPRLGKGLSCVIDKSVEASGIH